MAFPILRSTVSSSGGFAFDLVRQLLRMPTKLLPLSRTETRVLGALAVFGFVVPNGVFVYAVLDDPRTLRAAIENPVSLVFMFEAFFLMGLFAWLLAKARATRPRPFAFIAMSLIGSLAFSVPATLYLWFRRESRMSDAPKPPARGS